MINFQQVPSWMLILVVLASAGAFAWRYMTLLAPWKLQRYVLIGLLSGTLVFVLIALVKGNSANHTLLLFIDAMVMLLVGSLPIGRDVRRYKQIQAETGNLPPFVVKHANSTALLMTGAVVVLIIGEYALGSHH